MLAAMIIGSIRFFFSLHICSVCVTCSCSCANRICMALLCFFFALRSSKQKEDFGIDSLLCKVFVTFETLLLVLRTYTTTLRLGGISMFHLTSRR